RCGFYSKVSVELYILFSFFLFIPIMVSFHSSKEKNFCVTFLKVFTFCSASITTLLYSYLTLNYFSTVRKKLDFLPSSVIWILSLISKFSSRSDLIFLYAVV